MKKQSLFSLLFVVFAASAIAAERPGDQCSMTGAVSLQAPSGEVMHCTDGKWTVLGHAGDAPVKLSVQLTDGAKTILSIDLTTHDGQPTPISIAREHAYVASAAKESGKVTTTPRIAREGFWMTVTPKLTKDGKIEVVLNAAKSELTAMNNFKQGDLEIQLPQLSSIEWKQKVILEDGKAATIMVSTPSAPVGHPEKDSSAGWGRYTLKLTATKG